MANSVARTPYARRNRAPKVYDASWYDIELQNIQRAIPVFAIKTIVANYTPTANDFTVLVDASGGAVSITLNAPDQVQSLLLNIKKIDASGNAVTIVGTIDGMTNYTLASQYDGVTIQSSGSEYVVLGAV